ncbi:hypothetical protein XF_0492 [Xylella fastidiosa 9a5c]|uniref:Uncharacterized protein n=1 Tax=Xylella fastidiosa (strain 9a5c) TaxID=160492 RepID=Q9PG10_XYLFA|nr:hypothetical protein [Xylella fastidiosa]AAF83302.1 hypothetical protein XF_0492 [Xylella fastidiosa 9a5c]
MSATTASETRKAPLFFWNCIRDEEGGVRTGVYYCEAEGGEAPEGTLEIVCFYRNYFSKLVWSWFGGRQDSEIKARLRDGEVEGYMHVHPAHPLYPQVKAAYEAREALFDSPPPSVNTCGGCNASASNEAAV